MHFSASSQWSKIYIGYQEITFNGKKVLKFSQIVLVRLGGVDPPPPPQSGQSDRFFPVFFLNPSLIVLKNHFHFHFSTLILNLPEGQICLSIKK